MHAPRIARVGTAGAAIAVALLAATAAHAQNTTTIPAPGLERYSLPPGANQPTPTPTPTPVPATPAPGLTPAPPPSVIPTLQLPRTTATSLPSPTPSPSTARPATARSAPSPSPVPTAAAPATATSPTPSPTGDVAPAPAPTSVPTPTPAPVADEPAATQSRVPPAGGAPPWLWWAIGLALAAAAGAFIRRRLVRGDAVTFDPQPAAPEDAPPAPTPSPPARPIAGVVPAAAQPGRALVLDFRPQRLWTRGPDAHLAFELIVTNAGAAPVDAVRPVIVLASAGPETAAEIAAFEASAPGLPASEPFGLRGGESRVVAGELTLPGDAMYVTSAADRELIVPLALVGVGWRAGLSVARASDAFVIGTGDPTSPRLGPIWVDRAGLVYAKLDARRFTPGTARGGA